MRSPSTEIASPPSPGRIDEQYKHGVLLFFASAEHEFRALWKPLEICVSRIRRAMPANHLRRFIPSPTDRRKPRDETQRTVACPQERAGPVEPARRGEPGRDGFLDSDVHDPPHPRCEDGTERGVQEKENEEESKEEQAHLNPPFYRPRG